MTALKVREIRIEDIEDILEIENACFETPWHRETFEEEILRNELAYYLVLVDEENSSKVVGYAGMWKVFDEAHITNIALLPLYQGKKFGHRLLNELIEFSKKIGVYSMTLEVRPSNTIARSLYEKFEFKSEGLRKGYYTDTNEDALIMWRRIL
ncbi:ribosomal protein S18-alanine N-acetyltransferase [Selenomonadales bacterium OttesenSCG-928-I06]|nr:ribosomal protein S18-alanine N-acetyltransferase [Selenomonadales bacterium OttesenSCG-928-I06]